MIPLTVVIVLSYLVGSFPTSLIVAKLVRGIDIRSYGSGNAGGTNVIRVLGWRVGVFVILIDAVKGYIATMIVTQLMYGPMPFNNYTPFDDVVLVRIIAGCAAILGHIWTLFGGFRGGKGIATAGGVLLSLSTVEFLIAIGVFSLVFVFSRYVSLGSISAAIAFPLSMFFRHSIFHADVEGYHTLIFFSIGIAILLIYNHRKNIQRLLDGTELRLTRVRIRNKSSL